MRCHRCVVSCVLAMAYGLASRLGNVLGADSACANYDVGHLLTAHPPRVTLIIMGVCGQKGVRNYAGGAAYGIDTLTHFCTPTVTSGAVRGMMGRDDKCLFALVAGDRLQCFLEPIKLRAVLAALSFEKTWIFKAIGIQPDNPHKRSFEHPVNARLRHRFAINASIGSLFGHRCSLRAEVRSERV